jgi:hypothetical protein
VRALGVWDGDLVAGGNFTRAGGTPGAKYVARWGGSAWYAIGDPDTVVNGLVDGDGTLVVADEEGVKFWDGGIWTPLGGGMNASASAVAVFGGKLFAAGAFSTAGTTSSLHIARWGSDQVGVGDVRRPLVTLAAFPNPFRAQSRVRFELKRPGPVNLGVFDMQGRRVAVLIDSVLGSDPIEVAWDGRDDRGCPLPAGVYYVRLKTASHTATRKLVRIR